MCLNSLVTVVECLCMQLSSCKSVVRANSKGGRRHDFTNFLVSFEHWSTFFVLEHLFGYILLLYFLFRDLESNAFTGTIPEELGNLANLEKL